MLLYLFAMYGLSWIASQSDLLARPRNWMSQHSGFIAQLLMCWYCVGFWSGMIVYLLGNAPRYWSLGELIVWGCAGSAASALGNAVWEKLSLVEAKENGQ